MRDLTRATAEAVVAGSSGRGRKADAKRLDAIRVRLHKHHRTGDARLRARLEGCLEVPERVSGRTWIRTDGTRTMIQCGQLPATGCP